MKQIINRRKYDTSSAIELAYYEFSHSGDFHHICESLYRKSNGEYFLHGYGGAMSKYSEQIGQNEWSGGEAITPITEELAQNWVENHAPEEYETIFGEVEEEEELDATVRCNFTITNQILKQGKAQAQAQNLTFSAYLAKLIRQDA